MSREIKFRAWNKDKKEWVHDSLFGVLGNGQIIHHNGMWRTNPKLIVSQFTGLKGKNGVEIYEGDIVVARFRGASLKYREQVAVIEWRVDGFGAYRDNEPQFAIGYCENPDEIEVIGNIYENPELLEEKASTALER